jgi:Flp pilus assembly protein CpaB
LSEAPGSPKAARLGSPSWLDGRLVLGVVLVLVSVLVGAKVLASADTSQTVWVATHDLAPGTVLTADDLELGKVRLFGASKLYLAGNKPLGYLVQRGVSKSELLPRDALTQPGQDTPRREITVPVPTGHLPPDLVGGQQVDVYVTPDAKSARADAKALVPRLVLEALTVSRIDRGGGLGSSGQDQSVVLGVDPAQVLVLVTAMSQGRLDLVRVPRSQQGQLTTAVPGT